MTLAHEIRLIKVPHASLTGNHGKKSTAHILFQSIFTLLLIITFDLLYKIKFHLSNPCGKIPWQSIV